MKGDLSSKFNKENSTIKRILNSDIEFVDRNGNIDVQVKIRIGKKILIKNNID